MAASRKTTKATAAAKPVKEETKAVEVKTAAPAAEEAKKAVKPAAKKPAAKKETKATVVFQYAGKEVVAKEVLAKAQAAYAETHKGTEIESIELYIVAEENMAYYVVNGDADPDFKVVL
ncbi:MAG: DUF6465 family protein [Lachnospiraceae bacterium]